MGREQSEVDEHRFDGIEDCERTKKEDHLYMKRQSHLYSSTFSK